ncbi:C40 family peptidase [Kitasatospora sp. NPDC008050]|uniref:C40 family peptidase n=1 Tax=Kitasatospora sp. NPDC008050 TaxID=3364021 RepID=UPI0036EBE7AD
MARRFLTVLLLTLTALAGPLAPPELTTATAAAPVRAVADEAPAPDGVPYPSTGSIADAKAESDRRAAAATAIEDRLTGAKAELEQAGREAEQAVEAYDGAQVKLARARGEAGAATTRAAAAEAARIDAAESAASLAAASYRLGASPELTAVNALLGAGGPRAAGEQAVVVGAAGRSSRQILDAATGTAKAAAEAARAAQHATGEAQQAAEAVQAAKGRAQERLTAQQQLVTQLDQQREQLLVELAAARDTTVELERRRQDALDAIAAQQAEAAAKAEAAAAAQAQAQAQAEAQAQAQQSAPRPAPAAPSADPGAAAAPGGASGGAADGAPWSGSGAQAALDFARSKIGLPYIWGGEGPAGYDCSGLTMLAWQQGGKRLTHFAADQYSESTPVSYGQLRPGDLVFWTHTGRAADIYHVAIYLGDDQIIEAPRTGVPIKQASLWIMGRPDFYARP